MIHCKKSRFSKTLSIFKTKIEIHEVLQNSDDDGIFLTHCVHEVHKERCTCKYLEENDFSSCILHDMIYALH